MDGWVEVVKCFNRGKRDKSRPCHPRAILGGANIRRWQFHCIESLVHKNEYVHHSSPVLSVCAEPRVARKEQQALWPCIGVLTCSRLRPSCAAFLSARFSRIKHYLGNQLIVPTEQSTVSYFFCKSYMCITSSTDIMRMSRENFSG